VVRWRCTPAVQDCAVFGVPDDKWGEMVTAMIECRAGVPHPPADELPAFARDRLGPVKTPKTLLCMDRLPRSSAGKVLRAQLRKPYWQNRERTI